MATIYDEVLRNLQADPKAWEQIAKDTGVPLPTIWRIGKGRTPNPRVRTMQALYDHFNKISRS